MKATDYALALYQHIDLTKPPVELPSILKAVDISVQAADLGGSALGYSVQMNERPLIIVDRGLSLARKRFTIAHELGHCIMHPGRGQLARTERTGRLERQADIFAATLLMPEPMVRSWWDRCRRRGFEEAVRQMAWDFQVSRRAMEIRLEELGFLAGAVGL